MSADLEAAGTLDGVEQRWLDYAWRVVACPPSHLSVCEAAGGAQPGPGRVDGNELRWPGYLAAGWRPGVGVLCVGSVHREGTLDMQDRDPMLGRTDRQLIAASRAWVAAGRSPAADARYLATVREAYEDALPRWGRWRRVFRPLVEDLLGMGVGEIAWANLAKCRVSIDRGDGQRGAEARVTRLCQREFVPVRELVEAIRPAAVVCSVLAAGEGGTIVSSWSGPTWRPLVFTFHGLTGHDRSNRDPARRASSEWAPEAAQAIKRAQLAPRAGGSSPNVKGSSRQEPRNGSRRSVLGGRRAPGLCAEEAARGPGDRELAQRASRYLASDRVRPAQAAAYRALLTSGPTGDAMRDFLLGISREHAIRLAGGDLRRSPAPDSLLRAIRAFERQLAPSHRWPKGIIATALALTEPDLPLKWDPARDGRA